MFKSSEFEEKDFTVGALLGESEPERYKKYCYRYDGTLWNALTFVVTIEWFKDDLFSSY